MKHKLIPIVAMVALVGAANAQVTGIRVRAGYGWSGSIPNTTTGSTHLVGPEIGFDFPIQRLPIVEIDFTLDWLMGGQLAHGGDLDGNVYRFLLSARATIPGSKLSVFGGVGWATAQARASEFGAFSGEVMQLGVGLPIGLSTPILAPSLEIAATMASRSGLSGFSVSLAVHF